MLEFFKLAAFQVSLYWLTRATADEETCPDGWSFVEKANRCYKYFATPVSWNVALRKCNRQNATLPTIHYRETNDAIGEFNAHRYYAFYHIGLRQGAAGEWQWTDGSPLGYVNWTGKGSLNSNDRPCAAARVGLQGVVGWYALDCNYTEWPTVCERPTLTRNGGSEQPQTTEQSTISEASAFTSAATDPTTTTEQGEPTATTTTATEATATTEQGRSTATTVVTNNGKEECKDKVSAWKCKSLTAIYACKAGAYFKYLEENCARSCGFCN
ncbi:type-2 ice-structuring protein-like protein [Aphelenchoides avenae]|nr:type-2 ice-structuring protein-like protein [Aphelenchus avenae]